jgi:putative PIN family toxin of toxin-antitoxin system
VIRALLDSNVVLSALLSPSGAPAAVVRAAVAREYVLVWSAPLVAECRRVAAYPHLRRRIAASRAEGFIADLEVLAEVVPSALPPLKAVQADPSDDVVLASALAAGAGWVVTGDRAHLLPLDPFHGIRIVTPADFLAALRGDEG